MRTGDVIVFKGSGPVFQVLSCLLGLFDKLWRKRKWKPWHAAIAYEQETAHTFKIVDSTEQGVGFNFLDLNRTDYKSFEWFDEPISMSAFNRWLYDYFGKPYDYDAYLGTAISFFMKRIFGTTMRIVDKQYYCTELVAEFCRYFGKPLQPQNEYPMPNIVIKALENG